MRSNLLTFSAWPVCDTELEDVSLGTCSFYGGAGAGGGLGDTKR